MQNMAQKAKAYCDERGLRFTDPRRHVLNIIAKSKKPIGAYDILEALGKHLKNPQPPNVYRALDFLQEHGFIHRIESLDAYNICHSDHHHKGSQYMICDDCGSASEIHMCDMPGDMKKKAASQGFGQKYWNLEIHGTCKDCAR